MKNRTALFVLLCAGLLMVGCATEQSHGRAPSGESTAIGRVKRLSAEARTRILALNPEQVSEQEVRDLLSNQPAPCIINIHGGVFPIKSGMNSFAHFLIGMGYPETSIRNPADGSYTYGYYDSSDEIAGAVAWHYERDGLRPMLVGHSQGGIQAIRVLHKLAGNSAIKLAVWNPVTQKQENRCEITDPLTGKSRPVVGLQVSYATAALAGGLARALPNQWDMNNKLRKIPDSVDEFTGFQKGMDLLGGDFLGYGDANDYHATGSAKVRNVRLPATSSHASIPYTSSLLNDPAVKVWIASYRPTSAGIHASSSSVEQESKNAQVLWAAEVWYDIKKHWVIELQRLIQAQNTNFYEG